MSHAPFDGVLLDDARPPIPGAMAMLLHLRVAQRMARARGWAVPGLDFVKGRAQACRELLAQGLFPASLRDLRAHLDLGHPGAPHSLATLIEHLEAYLAEVDRIGYLEPDEALWRAVDREMAGKRGLWIERTTDDGPISAGLRDLLPARLRALACVPGLAGAAFSLATSKGGGLFGSAQPLAAWLLDGLEQHGAELPNPLQLEEPEGWGSAPWIRELDRLFEGALDLVAHQDHFQRQLAEGPVDLLRHAVEQVCTWLDEGIEPKDITIIHPEPQHVAAFLEPILAAEGVALHVRGGLTPLIDSETWSPIWMLMTGLQRLDPCALSAGLRASQRGDLKRWADPLALSDQDGASAFETALVHLDEKTRERVRSTWTELVAWRDRRETPATWASLLESMVGTLRLGADSDDFYAPMGLLKEAWNQDAGRQGWTFDEMLTALRAFLEAARSTRTFRAPDGVRLLAPSTLIDEWNGSRATLILDLSEGGWPRAASVNPDLDWRRKAAINQALVAASTEPKPFPPALQRFWLPSSERSGQIPRAFQLDAYAFNKALAMTSEHLVALSPAQDENGRAKAQGPFWTALEGAGTWTPAPFRAASHLRWDWEGHEMDSPAGRRATARAESARARGEDESLAAEAPDFDRVPGYRTAWFDTNGNINPTPLETLATCPFRALATRVWKLESLDLSSRLAMAKGTLVHRVMEAALRPFLGVKDWPSAFLSDHGIQPDDGLEALLPWLSELWETHREAWLAELRDIPLEVQPQVVSDLEELLANLATALLLDARAKGPTKWELAFLFPDEMPLEKARGRLAKLPLQEGWTRTLLDLESSLGPFTLDLGHRDLGDDRSLALAGKLDRLERWQHLEGHRFLRVIDYKTSRNASLKAYAEGGAPFSSHLQTPLYMLIAEAVHGEPVTAALWPLREAGPKPFTEHLQPLLEVEDDGGWKQRLRTHLANFDARLERGDFPPTPGDHCRYCKLAALCGRPVDVAVDGASDEAAGDSGEEA